MYTFLLLCVFSKPALAQLGSRIRRPEILEAPTDADVIPGSSAVFSCRAIGTPQPTIFWKKDGELISSGLNWISNGKSLLRITNASPKHVGNYQCLAKSPSGVATSPVARLRYYQRRSQPRITHSPALTEVLRGETIMLYCGATGFPKPTFSWFKDGGRLSSFHDRFSVGEDGTLTITNAQLDDSAHYRCSATNYLGRASSAARVRVDLAIPDSRPIFTSKPRSAKVMAGEIVEFTCISRGHPYPSTTWWKNGRIINSDDRISVSDSGQHLRIENVRIQDRGEYLCRAENSHGREEVVTNLMTISRPSPISMLATPHDMSAPTGSTVQFPCRASGSPKPTLTWLKNDQPFSESVSKFKISLEGSLILYNVSSADEGTYQCVATNNIETLKSSAVFSVYNRRTTVSSFSVTTTFSSTTNFLSSSIPRIKSTTTPPFPSFEPSINTNYISSTSRNVLTTLFTSTAHIFSTTPTNESDNTLRVSALSPEEPSSPGDAFLFSAFDEAQNSVTSAVDSTVESFFHSNTNFSAPHDLRKIFRYPGANFREVARATEIFERTLSLIENAVRDQKDSSENIDVNSNFTYKDIVSTENLYLLANLSGCESHRSEKDLDCIKDLCFHSKYRTIDGTCNNYEHPLIGASLTTFKRLLLPEYENGFNTPIGWDREKKYNGFRMPSARLVSSSIASSSKIEVDGDLSHMAMQWGQFLDHDIDHSMEAISQKAFEDGITCSGTCGNRPPCFPIEVPLNDPRITDRPCIEFTRSSATCGSGSTSIFFDSFQFREQLNQLTSYIDASQVYGSEHDLAQNLRNLTNDYGRLREEQIPLEYPKPFLPFNINLPVDCRRDPRASNIGCFLAGDVRANEQLGLLAMHTIWFRQHNLLVTKLRELNPLWDGDRLYQESRKIVGAQMQHITYKHWLPLIIGKEGMRLMGKYNRYDPSVDSSISNVFATSSFRFGHTLIKPVLRRLNENFKSIDEGDLPLHEAFFSPWRLVQEGGVDPIIRGLFASAAKKPDPTSIMSEELTEKLFDKVHDIALDLGALNIQRGRDHGLPSYTKWRHFCRLDNQPIKTWEDLKAAAKLNNDSLTTLQKLYGHPENVDVWVGGMVEPIIPGAKVGKTVRCILVDQFYRLRAGDRFWYEHPSTFTPEQLSQIRQTSLAKILCDNGDDIRQIVKNVLTNELQNNKFETISCESILGPNLNPWFECDLENTNNVWSNSNRNRREILSTACISYDGGIKSPGEEWIHRDKFGSCAKCHCQEKGIQCVKHPSC